MHRRPVGHESAASPNEGGTAEGTTFRPGTNGRFLILEAPTAMTTSPIRSAWRRRSASPPTRTRSSCAPRVRPTSRRRSAPSSGSTTAAPAYLLESVEGGERLGRYSFLGVGPRRLLEVRDGVARIQTRPVTRRPVRARTCRSRRSTAPTRWPPSAPSSRAAASSRPRACRASPAAPSARSPMTRSRLRADRPAARSATPSASRRRRSSRPTSSSSSTT